VTPALRSGESPPGLTLLLRPWDARDIPQLLAIYRDPAMRPGSRNFIETEQDACRWLEVQQHGWADGHRLAFAVLDSEPGGESGRVLGNVVLKGWQTGRDAAEVGYWTAAAARNRGIASHAVRILTAWAFENFGARGLRRIELLHQQDNLASCRVAQKTGYVLAELLPADPPAFPSPGHLHVRHSEADPSSAAARESTQPEAVRHHED
jgi:RimJ/RimL family protein N-acetyltransferase